LARIDWRSETSATSNILRFEHTANGGCFKGRESSAGRA
jgi:hypothetical protein